MSTIAARTGSADPEATHLAAEAGEAAAQALGLAGALLATLAVVVATGLLRPVAACGRLLVLASGIA